jgi:hypothetical protein
MKYRGASLSGADGVVLVKHLFIYLISTTPSARKKVASRLFLIAPPPLLS